MSFITSDIDCTHFRRRRSLKVESTMFLPERKSASKELVGDVVTPPPSLRSTLPEYGGEGCYPLAPIILSANNVSQVCASGTAHSFYGDAMGKGGGVGRFRTDKLGRLKCKFLS